MRCRICDELVDHPKKDLTEDGVCKKKCAPASEGLFEDPDVTIVAFEDESLSFEDYTADILWAEGRNSDYE